MKEVVVCGKGPLIIRILEWIHNNQDYNVSYFIPVITSKVNPLPEWDNDDVFKFCAENNIKVIESGDFKDLPKKDRIYNCKYEYDFLIVAFYKKIIKKSEFNRFSKAINIHLSELPKYRGARGINWALKNNENFQGVTIHLIDELLDHGPIIAQTRFSIYPYFEEVIDVYYRALEYAFILFIQCFPNLDKIYPVPQKHSEHSYYSSKDFKNLGEKETFLKSSSNNKSS